MNRELKLQKEVSYMKYCIICLIIELERADKRKYRNIVKYLEEVISDKDYKTKEENADEIFKRLLGDKNVRN